MPTYEYQCSKCSHLYEKREGFDAPSTQKCPKCRGRAQRIIQAPPIVFKGSGFYKTDSRKAPVGSESESSGSNGAGSSESSSDTSSDASKATDSKPAAAASD